MADRKDKPGEGAGGATKRTPVDDSPDRDEQSTGAGQEARHGVPPADHEHQSNYGGGGAYGGAGKQ